MSILLLDLPPEAALLRLKGEPYDGWTLPVELAAQLIEVTSVAAAGMQLSKPREIPRPQPPTPRAQTQAEWSKAAQTALAKVPLGGRGGRE